MKGSRSKYQSPCFLVTSSSATFRPSSIWTTSITFRSPPPSFFWGTTRKRACNLPFGEKATCLTSGDVSVIGERDSTARERSSSVRVCVSVRFVCAERDFCE